MYAYYPSLEQRKLEGWWFSIRGFCFRCNYNILSNWSIMVKIFYFYLSLKFVCLLQIISQPHPWSRCTTLCKSKPNLCRFFILKALSWRNVRLLLIWRSSRRRNRLPTTVHQKLKTTHSEFVWFFCDRVHHLFFCCDSYHGNHGSETLRNSSSKLL